MSIRARVEDAVFLWEHGRLEGGFLSALVAVAASARRQFPDRKAINDRESFERFLSNAHTVRISVEYRGECHPIEHVFYKWLRCELVHEGGIPIDIQFMSDDKPGVMSIRAGGAPEYVLKISHGWFYHLINLVTRASINADEFPECNDEAQLAALYAGFTEEDRELAEEGLADYALRLREEDTG